MRDRSGNRDNPYVLSIILKSRGQCPAVTAPHIPFASKKAERVGQYSVHIGPFQKLGNHDSPKKCHFFYILPSLIVLLISIHVTSLFKVTPFFSCRWCVLWALNYPDVIYSVIFTPSYWLNLIYSLFAAKISAVSFGFYVYWFSIPFQIFLVARKFCSRYPQHSSVELRLRHIKSSFHL